MALGSVTIDLLLKTGAFNSDAKLAERRLKDMERTAKRVGAAIGVAIVGGATAATMAIRSQITAMDEMSKAALRAGMQTEHFSQLAHAANLSDVSIQDLTTSMGRLARSQSDAQRGLATQTEAFERLGIAFENADGSLRNGREVLLDFADAYRRFGSSPELLAAGMQIFGRSFQNLIPLLAGGRDGLEAAADEADRLGITLGTQAGRQAEAFNDNLTRLTTAVQGFWQEVATGLLPQLVDTTSAFQRIKTEGDLARNTVSLLTGVFDAGIWVIDQYNNAVDRTSIVIGTLARSSAGLEEIRKNFGVSGLFREGSVRQGYAEIQTAFEEGQRELDALIERQKRNREGQGLVALAGVDAAPSGMFARTPQQVAAEAAAKAAAEAAEAERLAAEAAAAGAKAKAEAEREYERALKASDDALREYTQTQMEAEARQLSWANRIDEWTAQMEGPASMAALELRRSVAAVDAALATADISVEQHGAALVALGDRYMQAVEAAEAAGGSMSTFADQAARNIQSTLGDSLYNVLDGNFRSIADSFSDMIKRMLAEAAAAKILEAFSGWATGYTGGGSGWINALGSAFGGGRASGGPVVAGRTYLVGEQGPELLRMGGNSGTVIPNNRLPSMGAAPAKVQLVVENHGQPVQAQASQRTAPDGTEIIRLVLGAVGESIAEGQGPAYAAMKGRFNLRDAV